MTRLVASLRARIAKVRARVAPYRKTAVYVLEAVAQCVALGAVHGTALHVAQGVLAVAGALGVYQVPNKPKAVV